MYARQITSEEKFTLSEAREILRKEKEEKLYFIKQKLMGLILILIGVIYPLISIGELGNANVSLVTIPIGVLLMITKRRVLV